MKILYLCSDLGIPVLGRKGAAVHVRVLSEALQRVGHSVVVAAPSLNKDPWEVPQKVNVALAHLPPSPEVVQAVLGVTEFNESLEIENSLPGELRRILYNQQLVPQLTRRFRNHAPDFILERASLYATAGVHVARALNVPLIVELNAPLALEQSAYRATGLGKLAAQAEHWALTRADAVFAVSDPLRDYVMSLGVASERVHVLPNGVDTTLFYPALRNSELRARLNLGDGPVLGFIGGLRPWHGVQVLPLLVERLVPRYPHLRLVIAGEGPMRTELEAAFRTRGIHEHVIFTGSLPHEEMSELIRQFDIALAPYPVLDHVFYFSPLKLFEYMACGVPVVAAAVGQIAEVIRDGDTGLLYPPGDLDALTAACARLLADSALCQRLGEAAGAEVHANYTWTRNATRIVELARTLIAYRAGG